MKKILFHLQSSLQKKFSRRQFLKSGLAALLSLLLSNRLFKLAFAGDETSTGRPKNTCKGLYDIVVAEGNDPYRNTMKVIEAMGGMEKFVKKNSIVVVKPNMAWDRTPEQAANTNPQVVAALVELCYKAGAKRVNVFDIPCNDEKSVYETTGIKKAAEEKGAFVYFANHWDVLKAQFPYDSSMHNWPILRDAIACDIFINVPVLKHHGYTKLTLSMKNLMGICSGNRGLMHLGITSRLVDITDFINPNLTVIDATRVLMKNGPTGGNLDDVVALNKVFAATDPVLADSFACSLINQDPFSISYIKAAAQRGLGNTDLSKVKIHAIKT